MASYSEPKIEAYKQDAACSAFKCVKKGTDDQHVAVASAGSDKVIGVQQNISLAAEDVVEVAKDGGGGKGRLGVGGAVFGDKLVSDANGNLIVSTTANDRIVAIAGQDGVENDVIAIDVALSNL